MKDAQGAVESRTLVFSIVGVSGALAGERAAAGGMEGGGAFSIVGRDEFDTYSVDVRDLSGQSLTGTGGFTGEAMIVSTPYGDLTVIPGTDAGGAYSVAYHFALDGSRDAARALSPGSAQSLRYDIVVSDGHAQVSFTVNIAIQGGEDRPVLVIRGGSDADTPASWRLEEVAR